MDLKSNISGFLNSIYKTFVLVHILLNNVQQFVMCKSKDEKKGGKKLVD